VKALAWSMGVLASGLLVLASTTPARADVYDLKYVVTRKWCEECQKYCTTYENHYEEDEYGNPIYYNSLPINPGRDPNYWDYFWLDAGYQVTICPPDTPGGDPIVGPITPIPGPPGPGPPVPPGPAPWPRRWFPAHRDINKSMKEDVIVHAISGQWKYRQVRPPPPGPWQDLPICQEVVLNGPGMNCYQFRCVGGDIPIIDIVGCEATITSVDELTDVSGVYLAKGAWPDDSPPSFYEDVDFTYLYIGDFDLGDGMIPGTASITCLTNIDDFLSVATPEAYTGCPEPLTVCWLLLGSVFLRRRRRFI